MATATQTHASQFSLRVFILCLSKQFSANRILRSLFLYSSSVPCVDCTQHTNLFCQYNRTYATRHENSMICDFHQWKCHRGLSTTASSKPEPIKKKQPDGGNVCAHSAYESYSMGIDDSVRRAWKKIVEQDDCEIVKGFIWIARYGMIGVDGERACDTCTHMPLLLFNRHKFAKVVFPVSICLSIHSTTIQANPFSGQPSHFNTDESQYVRKSILNQNRANSNIFFIRIWIVRNEFRPIQRFVSLPTMSAMCSSGLINPFEMNAIELSNWMCGDILRN